MRTSRAVLVEKGLDRNANVSTRLKSFESKGRSVKIRLKGAGNKDLAVVCSHLGHQDEFWPSLDDAVSLMDRGRKLRKFQHLAWVGDMNVDFLKRHTAEHGTKATALSEVAQKNQLEWNAERTKANLFTWHRGRSRSYIDHVLTDAILGCNVRHLWLDLPGDHALSEVALTAYLQPIPRKKRRKIKWEVLDGDLFENSASDFFAEVRDDIEDLWSPEHSEQVLDRIIESKREYLPAEVETSMHPLATKAVKVMHIIGSFIDRHNCTGRTCKRNRDSLELCELKRLARVTLDEDSRFQLQKEIFRRKLSEVKERKAAKEKADMVKGSWYIRKAEKLYRFSSLIVDGQPEYDETVLADLVAQEFQSRWSAKLPHDSELLEHV